MSKAQQADLEKLQEMAERIDGEAEEALQESISQHPLGDVSIGATRQEPELELGLRLQEARKQAGLTQGELSNKTKLVDKDGTGISSAVISLYERGINRPGPKEIRLLCEVLRVSPNFLIYGDTDPFGSLGEDDRYLGWARTESEFYAVMTYCFSRLHHHHRLAILQLMIGLLRGWNNAFDDELAANAVDKYLKLADELRLAQEKAKPSK